MIRGCVHALRVLQICKLIWTSEFLASLIFCGGGSVGSGKSMEEDEDEDEEEEKEEEEEEEEEKEEVEE